MERGKALEVERWHSETYTFHLRCGECTDVTLQLELPINGSAVTGANFEHLPSTANEWEVMQVIRAYIMHLIRGVLMPDANGNRVHSMYLPPLSNLHNTRSYSWGFAVLTMLYRELCRMTDPSVMDIGRCLILLQSWALYQMPFLAPIVTNHMYFHLLIDGALIWVSGGREIKTSKYRKQKGFLVPHCLFITLVRAGSYTIPICRLMIENHAGDRKLWQLFPRLPASTQTYGALAHPLSIFRQWSGIMAIEYFDSLIAYSISRHC
ncbi:hypothetical protein CXB51_008007 [Gossypium anomalum]|uniref:Aminotransferase-like plant mobile domain-containing protein n=1 Tax=Gossypium anomalum TaxID=47600 RepID=A0A8J5ZCV6_9ROSI|nr:hypothetical protein CXB51_008007 [Gossypium anomalum]